MKTLLIALVTLLIPTLSNASQSNHTYDCGVLTGLSAASNNLQSWTLGRAINLDGWVSHWQNNWKKAEAFKADLNTLAFENALVTDRLIDAQRIIDSLPENGNGDLYYWRDMVENQIKAFTKVHELIASLRDKVCQN